MCKFVPKPVQREVCEEVKMRGFTEKCDDVPVDRPTVDCGMEMMPLALKEICIKIDFRLPRQECKLEKKENCRFVPRKKMVQKCDPVVREECKMVMKTECSNICKEECEEQDKKVCMTIPHQECEEKPVENCQDVPRTKCRKV